MLDDSRCCWSGSMLIFGTRYFHFMENNKILIAFCVCVYCAGLGACWYMAIAADSDNVYPCALGMPSTVQVQGATCNVKIFYQHRTLELLNCDHTIKFWTIKHLVLSLQPYRRCNLHLSMNVLHLYTFVSVCVCGCIGICMRISQSVRVFYACIVHTVHSYFAALHLYGKQICAPNSIIDRPSNKM